MDTSCIILAGGKGLRLGHDKVLETVGNKSLLQQTISCIDSFCSDIIIVTAGGRNISPVIRHPKLKIITDTFPGKGPLGGIYTGLAASDSSCNLVVAADMPFLSQALLRHLIQLAADDFDLVVPRVGNLTEPLHAVYAKSCLAPIKHLIMQNDLSILKLFNMVRVRYVEAEEIGRFDSKYLSFFNINTQADLIRARELARGDCK